jgi:hypothetical protein
MATPMIATPISAACTTRPRRVNQLRFTPLHHSAARTFGALRCLYRMRLYAVAVLALVSCRAHYSIVNGASTSSIEDGKRATRLSPTGGNRKGSNVAMALVDGSEFGEGTIEIDLKGNGNGQPSFLGVAFGISDGKTYEAVYFRPFNFAAEDAVHRAHAVQYVAWPEHTWEELRTRAPGVYESAIDPVPDPARWFHASIDVAKTKVSVFVDGASKPCLVVDRLGSARKGRVGLWVDSQEGAFANLKILPAK